MKSVFKLNFIRGEIFKKFLFFITTEDKFTRLMWEPLKQATIENGKFFKSINYFVRFIFNNKWQNISHLQIQECLLLEEEFGSDKSPVDGDAFSLVRSCCKSKEFTMRRGVIFENVFKFDGASVAVGDAGSLNSGIVKFDMILLPLNSFHSRFSHFFFNSKGYHTI